MTRAFSQHREGASPQASSLGGKRLRALRRAFLEQSSGLREKSGSAPGPVAKLLSVDSTALEERPHVALSMQPIRRPSDASSAARITHSTANWSSRVKPLRSYNRFKKAAQNELIERRRHLVEEYTPLLRNMARRILRRVRAAAGSEIEEMDLVSAGIIGLFEADLRYEPSSGKPFETYAEFRIKGAMLDELRRRDFFPRRLRVKANKLRKMEKSLHAKLKRPPNELELAQGMGLSVDELRSLQEEVAPYHFVDASAPETVLPAETPSAFALVANQEQRALLLDALKTLPERDQLILDLYYNQELTLREIGDILELTVGRVSQLKTASVETLKKLVHRQGL